MIPILIGLLGCGTSAPTPAEPAPAGSTRVQLDPATRQAFDAIRATVTDVEIGNDEALKEIARNLDDHINALAATSALRGADREALDAYLQRLQGEVHKLARVDSARGVQQLVKVKQVVQDFDDQFE